MLVDHHLHILEKNKGALTKYISSGKEKGVKVFGFSEHAYMFEEAHAMNFNDWQNKKRNFKLEDYIKTLTKLKEKYNQILIGLEVDYFKQKEPAIKKFMADCQKKYPFDFFIGSVHWLGEWGFDLNSKEYAIQIKKQGIEKVYNEYFKIIEKMIALNIFDIIGHIDLIKLFGAVSQNKNHRRKIVEILKKFKPVIEINTNGKNKPINEFYPGIDLLKECRGNNIEITFSSDAHTAERVGEYFDELLAMVKEIGYKKIVYFKNRKKHYLKI